MTPIADLAQQLRGQWKLLQVQEHQMAEKWRDSGYQRFRQRHWGHWEAALPTLFPLLERLDQVAERALAVTEDP